MNEDHIDKISKELELPKSKVSATAKLIVEGGTVPFIARYRKEATGSLDEVQITQIRDLLSKHAELDARRKSIIKSLEEQKVITDTLRKAIENADSLARLEDIYQPYRPKRRTRAMIAKERGLEPLAQSIFENQNDDFALEAPKFIAKEKEILTVENALAGARDIIAEWVNDNPDARAKMRKLYEKEGVIKSEVMPTKEEEAVKYKDYFDWSESIHSAPSHRILAIRRGTQEGFLCFTISPPAETAISLLEHQFVNGKGPNAKQVSMAIEDSYKRLLGPSMQTEIRVSSKKKADEAAINVFADNLRELLLASPLGGKRVLAIDPGLRTGCKVACLDAQGSLLHDDIIYLSQSKQQSDDARFKIETLTKKLNIEAIAIGNGTASRETETFIRSLNLPKSIPIVVVNESGASIYSASEIARKEFPDKDITVRGTVSIGRRLLDPLAELVKLDPKSIGVGQYQHDVDQRKLKEKLDDVVISCVNHVGVDLNTASAPLLAYVAGLNNRIADNIVDHRKEKGPFKSRKEVLKVAGLGPKAFEQAAGFLRINNPINPLDKSAVHPESYPVVERMAKDQGCAIEDLIDNDANRKNIKLEKYVSDSIGIPTLQDILNELAKPGRDPREQFEVFSFADGINEIEDLKPGMKLPGIVTNVAAFGAFVDVGVHQDGLVHISEIADKFIENPADVVKVQQKVNVTVLEVDVARKRISLSMKTQTDVRREKQTENRNDRQSKKKIIQRSNKPKQFKKRQESPPANDDWFSAALNKGRKR